MSSATNRGYASRRSSLAAPSASLRNRSSTGIRVPRITGLPCMTLGLTSTRSVMVRTPVQLYRIHSIYLKSMATVTEIGSLISRRPDIRGGRPCIAGTGVSVRRIVQWHNTGQIPEEVVQTFGGHLSLAHVHAALAYYYANQEEISRVLIVSD